MKPWGRRPGDAGRAGERGGGGGGGTGPAPRRQAPRPRPRSCRWGAHGGGRLREACRSRRKRGCHGREEPLTSTEQNWAPARPRARTPGRPPSLSPCTRGRPGGNRLSGCPDVTSFLPCAAKNRPALLAGDGGGSSEFYKNLGEAADAPSGGLVPRVSEPLDSRSVVLRCPVPVRRWPDRRGGAHRPAAAGALPDAGRVAGASVQTAAPPVPLPLSVACDVASPFSGSCVALRSVRS